MKRWIIPFFGDESSLVEAIQQHPECRLVPAMLVVPATSSLYEDDDFRETLQDHGAEEPGPVSEGDLLQEALDAYEALSLEARTLFRERIALEFP